jgi:hypothetical protein
MSGMIRDRFMNTRLLAAVAWLAVAANGLALQGPITAADAKQHIGVAQRLCVGKSCRHDMQLRPAGSRHF